MTTTTNPQEADQRALDDRFYLRMEEYALADAKGLAQPHISKALRSEKWVKDWNSILGIIAAKSHLLSKPLRTRIGELRIEAATLKRQLKIVERNIASSPSKIRDTVTEKTGLTFDRDYMPSEMTTLLLSEIYALLKRLIK